MVDHGLTSIISYHVITNSGAIMKIIFPVFSLFLLLAAQPVKSESIDDLVIQMGKVMSSTEQLNEAVTMGSLRIRLCQYCHGKDGNSKQSNIPNLAQQSPVYLLTQFEYFRSGERKNKVMNELAGGLTKDERINVALYYANQKVKVDPKSYAFTVGDRARGEEIYKGICVNCHGKKGYGDENLPRIAGQKYQFIKETLTAYKNNKGKRPDSAMVSVSTGLTNVDIMSIAAYVSVMK